jgi:hypothetical protein
MANADKAYGSQEIRDYNKNRGIVTNIPVNKRNRKNSNIGSPLSLNRGLYIGKNVVEGFLAG